MTQADDLMNLPVLALIRSLGRSLPDHPSRPSVTVTAPASAVPGN
jgi:hypothetical protein